MSFKTVTTFPIFIPIPSLTTITTSPTTTEIRFSRWNNANADKFNHLRRTQQQIQDDLRRLRRFETADNLTSLPSTTNTTTHTFKSTGTPSSPSLPSIPGKKSKYSKPPNPNPNPNPRFDTAVRVRGNGTFRNGRGETGLTVAGNGPSRSPSRNESAIVVDADETFRNVERNGLSHPAFRKVNRKTRLPFRNEEGVIVEPSRNGEGETGVYDVETFRDGEGKRGVGVKVNEDGLTYVVDGAPFEFQYSYTETPKVKPLALRESPVAPFGPGTMPRPWTGRKPFPPSKKNLPEFDSFNPPPAGKKGVKPVQKPGPFLDGSGPRYVKTREEILGEVLTRDEVVELVEGCRKTKRQLNMGRDGLTHNMLDNIHAHWKRRRVCKIKCKGVCTVDMDNVCQQLEEKSGGKIIYHRGGIVYLFRGRNYNYKTRPRYPLMLWKPIAPVYPRLIKRIPEGLTLEEASDMRKRGRDLPPICKLGKNGVYVNLVKDVKEAFEACELVRVDCQGLNPSDYRKIGAKLKDLVPCVLISFENEHILMWRGRDWKSSYFPDEDGSMGVKSTENDSAASQSLYADLLASEDDEDGDGDGDGDEEANEEMAKGSIDLTDSDVDVGVNSFGKDFVPFEVNDQIRPHASALENETMLNSDILSDNDIKFIHQLETGTSEKPNSTLIESDSRIDKGQQGIIQNNSEEGSPSVSDSSCQDGVLLLLKQAVEDGSAMILDNSSLDADMVFERSVEFALVAPPGPVFRHRPRKIRIQTVEDQDSGDTEVNKEVVVSENKPNVKKPKERKSSRTSKTKDFKEDYSNLVPQGSLKVDELAKLLA